MEDDGLKIGKRDDVNPKEGTEKYGDVEFADPVNKKYPIDNEEHIRAAWNYINKADDASKYSAEEVATIKRRIIAAWKEKIDKSGPPAAEQKKSLSDALDELKKGAKVSKDDLAIFDQIDALLKQLKGEEVAEENAEGAGEDSNSDKSLDFSDPDNTLVATGGSVKVVSSEGGLTRIRGALIRFTAPGDYDLSPMRDRFDANETDFDFDFPGKSATYFNHTMPVYSKKTGKEIRVTKKMTPATLTKDDKAVWMDAVLDERDEYEKFLADLAREGKLGLSSGTAKHLITRKDEGKGNLITRWPLGLDASYTHMPAESRNTVEVVSLKSLLNTNHELSEDQKENEMDEKMKQEITDLVTFTVTEAMKKITPDTAEAGVKTVNANTKTSRGFKDDAVKGFLHWVQTGRVNGALIPITAEFQEDDDDNTKDGRKAALAGQNDAAGGFMVPDDFYGKIIAKRNESSVPARLGIQRLPITHDRILVPVENVADTKFVVSGEGASYSEEEPTTGQVPIPAWKMTKLIKFSEEWEADAPGADEYMASIWGRALAAADNFYFVNGGTGTGQPQAMVNGGNKGITAANAASIVPADLINLIYAMPDQYMDNVALIMSRAVLGIIRGLTVANYFAFTDTPAGKGQGKGDNLTFTNGVPGGVNDGYIQGVPVFCTNAMPTANPVVTGTKTIAMVNPGFYGIGERQSLAVTRNPYLYEATGQIGLFARVRQGGAVLQAEACLYMQQA